MLRPLGVTPCTPNRNIIFQFNTHKLRFVIKRCIQVKSIQFMTKTRKWSQITSTSEKWNVCVIWTEVKENVEVAKHENFYKV